MKCEGGVRTYRSGESLRTPPYSLSHWEKTMLNGGGKGGQCEECWGGAAPGGMGNRKGEAPQEGVGCAAPHSRKVIFLFYSFNVN